jgi:hypothetical protein
MKCIGSPPMFVNLVDVRFYCRVEMLNGSFVASSWPYCEDVEGRW